MCVAEWVWMNARVRAHAFSQAIVVEHATRLSWRARNSSVSSLRNAVSRDAVVHAATNAELISTACSNALTRIVPFPRRAGLLAWMGSSHVHAAIDGNIGPRHEGGLIGAQKRNQCGHL